MGLTKTENYTEEQIELSNLAKALGHPARAAIIEYIAGQDSCICGDIVEVLPIAQATVSQHLKELKQSGLIKGNIEGNSVCYCIDTEKWNKFMSILENYTNKIHKVECC